MPGLSVLRGPSRAENEIVAAQGVGERALDGKTERHTRLKLDQIAGLGESHKAHQLVIAVIAPAEHLQGEIDFRPSGSRSASSTCAAPLS